MQVPVAVPAVWVQTTSDAYNTMRAIPYPQFLTPEQQARLERVRQSRLLYDGKHREYYLTEQRTQFDFSRLVAGTRPIQPYVMYNVLGLISNKGTDLLFGDEPLIRAANPAQQKSLQELAERCMLHPLLAAAALSCSYVGDCHLEACVYEGEVCLRQVPDDEIFPVGPILPNGQYGSYVRYNVKNVGTKASPIPILREVTYAPGTITRTAWELDRTTGQKYRQVDLSVFINGADNPLPEQQALVYGYDTSPLGAASIANNRPEVAQNQDAIPGQELQPVTKTGIDRCTVIWIPNGISRGFAISDYDPCLDLQDALNAKNSQLATIFAKHADPALASPEEGADDQGNARSSNRQFWYSDPERIPKYIVWNAETKAAMEDRDFVLANLIVAAESSPVLLGIKSDGVKAVAYKSFRLMAQNAISKAKRKSTYWTAGLRRALSVAQQLECAVIPGIRYDAEPVQITLQDGIPTDAIDAANEVAIYRGAGVMSVDRAVRLQLPDPAAADAELKQIEDEKKANTPPVFFSPGVDAGPLDNSTSAGQADPNDPDAPTPGAANPKADDAEAADEVEA